MNEVSVTSPTPVSPLRSSRSWFVVAKEESEGSPYYLSLSKVLISDIIIALNHNYHQTVHCLKPDWLWETFGKKYFYY